jgi:hypothetical protein
MIALTPQSRWRNCCLAFLCLMCQQSGGILVYCNPGVLTKSWGNLLYIRLVVRGSFWPYPEGSDGGPDLVLEPFVMYLVDSSGGFLYLNPEGPDPVLGHILSRNLTIDPIDLVIWRGIQFIFWLSLGEKCLAFDWQLYAVPQGREVFLVLKEALGWWDLTIDSVFWRGIQFIFDLVL